MGPSVKHTVPSFSLAQISVIMAPSHKLRMLRLTLSLIFPSPTI